MDKMALSLYPHASDGFGDFDPGDGCLAFQLLYLLLLLLVDLRLEGTTHFFLHW